MVIRFIKRILVFSSVACLVLACVPTLSFAVDPVSGAMALAGAMDAYGMAYGVGTVYDVSSSSGVTSSFEGLWDEFSSFQSNAGSQFDYDSFMDDYNQNRSLYGFEHSSGKFAAWYIDSESAEIFDQFWNWLLTGPAEMTRVDNQYFQFGSSQIGDNSTPINVLSSGSFLRAPVVSSPAADSSTFNSSVVVAYRSDDSTLVASSSSVSDVFICFVNGQVFFYSVDPFVGYVIIQSSNGTYSLSSFTGGTVSGFDYYRAAGTGINPNYYDRYAPVFSSIPDANSAFTSFVLAGSPIDSVGVKAHDETGIATLPNPYGLDYVPTPLEIVTNIPWDSSYDDTDEEDGQPVPFPPLDVPLVVDDIITAISAEDYSIEEDPQNPDPDPPPPAPSEVFVPLLPVGLPSFNFSLSGIWHYVREWVASLGAWFTTMFTIWSALPYAMVVPVYATAVVVIVLGVYKRFFM